MDSDDRSTSSRRTKHFGLVAAVAMAVLLVCVPGGMDSPFDGAPLGASGRVALSFIFCLAACVYFFPLRRPPGRWLLAMLVAFVALKIGVSLLSVPHGWRTTYAFGDTTGKMHDAQFFWHFVSRGFRIEPNIVISDNYSNLHFFNDIPLYGYPPYIQTRRDVRFPIVVTWTGHVDATAPRNLVVIASGNGRLTIATSAEARTWDDARSVQYPLRLAPGPQQIVLTYTKPADVAPTMRAELLNEEMNAGVSTTPNPPSGRRWGGSRVTTAIVLSGLALLFVTVTVGYVRFGTSAASGTLLVRAAALVTTVVLVRWATVLALEMVWRTRTFGPGGDPLAYASYALDILHHGPLMLQGLPIGQAAPFYFYPLYPYLLAAAHALVGEDVSTIYLVNGWLLALLPALFFALGWKQLPRVAGSLAFTALLGFTYVYTKQFIEFPDPVFTDFLFLPLVFLSLVALTRALANPTPKRLLLTGIVMALGAATRPSLMTLIYLTPFALWFAMGRPSVMRWAKATAWVAAGVFVGLLPFTIRNLIASGQFVMLVNSWIQIPYFLIPPEMVDRPGGIPTLGQALVMAKDIFLAYPMRTITVELRKILYTLGYTDAGPAGFDNARLFMGLTALFVWSIGSRKVRGPLAIAAVTFAVSHLAAMIIAAPWTFHYKSILPLHAVFLFGAAFLLDRRSAAPVAG
jgi:hypothetical protein